jgi:hypothetical protein
MGEKFDLVAPEVQEHVRRLAEKVGLGADEETLESMAAGWLDKQASFFEQTKQRNMEEVDKYENSDHRGVLIMTYSGSLISIGPMLEFGRSAEYNAIGLRSDVPETAVSEDVIIAADVEKDGIVEFFNGPIKKSSPIYAIAVMPQEMGLEEQQEQLGEVTMMLTQDFVDVNKTIMEEGVKA